MQDGYHRVYKVKDLFKKKKRKLDLFEAVI